MEPFIIISHKDVHENWRCGDIQDRFPAETKFAVFDDQKKAAEYIAQLGNSRAKDDQEFFRHEIIFQKQLSALVGNSFDIENIETQEYHYYDKERMDAIREEILDMAGAESNRMIQEREEKARLERLERVKEQEERKKQAEAEALVRKEKEERELFERLKLKFESK